MTIQETIAPLGHTIIALSAPPLAGPDTLTWIAHLNSVSDPINQTHIECYAFAITVRLEKNQNLQQLWQQLWRIQPIQLYPLME